MPLTAQDVENAKRPKDIISFLEGLIDEELAAGRYTDLHIHYSRREPLKIQQNEVTDELVTRIRKDYLKAGWKDMRIEKDTSYGFGPSSDFIKVTLVK